MLVKTAFLSILTLLLLTSMGRDRYSHKYVVHCKNEISHCEVTCRDSALQGRTYIRIQMMRRTDCIEYPSTLDIFYLQNTAKDVYTGFTDVNGCFDTLCPAGLYWFEPAIMDHRGSDTISLRPNTVANITLHIKPIGLNPYDIYSRRKLTKQEVQSISDSICCTCSHPLIRDNTCYITMEI